MIFRPPQRWIAFRPGKCFAEWVPDTISPSDKGQTSSRKSRGSVRTGLVIRGGKIPLQAQLFIIFVTFAILLLSVFVLFTRMDQPLSTSPSTFGPGN